MGAVERVLGKARYITTPPAYYASPYTQLTNSNLRETGFSSFDLSLEKKEVVVKTTVPYDSVLEKIKKTSKDVRQSIHHP